GHVPNFFLAVGGVVAAPALMRGWIDLVNAGSGALLDPATGLPGLAQVEGFDRLSVLGVIGPVYLLFALALAFQRAKLLLYVLLLLIAAPVALASWAIPAEYAQRFVRWWGATFLAVTLVQVLQAGVLATGVALLSSSLVAGRYAGPVQGAF